MLQNYIILSQPINVFNCVYEPYKAILILEILSLKKTYKTQEKPY